MPAATDADAPQNIRPGTVTGTNMYSSVNNGGAPDQYANATLPLLQPVLPLPAPLTNIQPVMGMNYVICMFGSFLQELMPVHHIVTNLLDLHIYMADSSRFI
ncbi:MAG: hypothetical protein IPI88_10840 [Chitinophagaceae bacterium]|nr:hypothetical protein [Chitinophagaceae bacterium]